MAAWIQAGLTKEGMSQSELARRLTTLLNRKYYPSTINTILSGSRGLDLNEAVAISQILSVEVPIAEDVRKRQTIPLVGYVSAGAQAVMYSEGQGPFDLVEPPEGIMFAPGTVAVEVRGDSMFPQLRDGWRLFYKDHKDAPTPDLYGKLCVIGAEDGQVYIKELQAGSEPGMFTLVSVNAPPIFGARVKWAAKVTGIEPR